MRLISNDFKWMELRSMHYIRFSHSFECNVLVIHLSATFLNPFILTQIIIIMLCYFFSCEVQCNLFYFLFLFSVVTLLYAWEKSMFHTRERINLPRLFIYFSFDMKRKWWSFYRFYFIILTFNQRIDRFFF